MVNGYIATRILSLGGGKCVYIGNLSSVILAMQTRVWVSGWLVVVFYHPRIHHHASFTRGGSDARRYLTATLASAVHRCMYPFNRARIFRPIVLAMV